MGSYNLMKRKFLRILVGLQLQLQKKIADSEFEKYRIVQDKIFKSDFDKLNDILD